VARSPQNREDRLTQEMVFPNEDWVMSPSAMRGYLQYRLHIVEHQIDRLFQQLERHDAPPFPTDLEDRAFPAKSWASWAQLNYLMRARDALQDALSRPKRKLN
jgi:hypothetical protein